MPVPSHGAGVPGSKGAAGVPCLVEDMGDEARLVVSRCGLRKFGVSEVTLSVYSINEDAGSEFLLVQ